MQYLGITFALFITMGRIRYIYAVDKEADEYYGMVTIDPVGESTRWDSYNDEHKRCVIRKILHL